MSGRAVALYKLNCLTCRCRGSFKNSIWKVRGAAALGFHNAVSGVWWELLDSLSFPMVMLPDRDGSVHKAPRPHSNPLQLHLEVVGDCIFSLWYQRMYGTCKEYNSNLLQNVMKRAPEQPFNVRYRASKSISERVWKSLKPKRTSIQKTVLNFIKVLMLYVGDQ